LSLSFSASVPPFASAFPSSAAAADAAHITANAGDSIVFNCGVEFPGPDLHPVPYVVQWWRKDKELPIYIWYDNYPTHADKDYTGRVSKVDAYSTEGSNYGLASLNISGVTEKDRGWYNCKVLFLNRGPEKAMVRKWKLLINYICLCRGGWLSRGSTTLAF
jgi:hypothetical protein